MTVSIFITLLTVFSTVTGLFTEAIKRLLDERKISYSTNTLAFFVANIVGVAGTGIYYSLTSVPFNSLNVMGMILMGVATSLGAMVGYDKIIQTIQQFGEVKKK